ncbi:MAG: hypothetical protein GVY08_03435 [Bacteroidetes bacterium]|nr:hypothetical protein [Bacteroidota bacterium]
MANGLGNVMRGFWHVNSSDEKSRQAIPSVQSSDEWSVSVERVAAPLLSDMEK